MHKIALLGIFLALFCICNHTEAKDKMNALNTKEQKIVNIGMYTARGDMPNLKTALNEGLDAGLTVNEIKEVLTQLYAYCGFPRSLNALGNFMRLLEERREKGVLDEQGKLPGALPAGKSIDFGTANQTKLCGAPVKGALFEFAPAIDEYLKAHLFGDIFARDTLDWRTRELATIAALAAMNGVESQLASHIAIGRHNGVTDSQIDWILENVKGSSLSVFPRGDENTAYAKYFVGKSYLAPLTKDKRLNVPVSNVTFEPSCRNNWHRHTGGQLLIAVGGIVGFPLGARLHRIVYDNGYAQHIHKSFAVVAVALLTSTLCSIFGLQAQSRVIMIGIAVLLMVYLGLFALYTKKHPREIIR